MQVQRVSSRTTASIPFTFSRYSIAHPGHSERNEDRILVDRQGGLAGVFDGVGSASGDIASRMAVSVIRRGWRLALQRIQEEPSAILPDLHVLLEALIANAHSQIGTKGIRQAEARGAGKKTATTAALAIFSSQSQGAGSEKGYLMTFAHVGDSRIYLLRNHKLFYSLTQDDGYLGILLREQKISEDEARYIDQADQAEQLTTIEREYFDKRNGITQALGDRYPHPLQIHQGQIPLIPGDRILLCTDGIHDNLTDREIAGTLSQAARTTAARKLVQQAFQRSQEDNAHLRAKMDDISAVVAIYTPATH